MMPPTAAAPQTAAPQTSPRLGFIKKKAAPMSEDKMHEALMTGGPPGLEKPCVGVSTQFSEIPTPPQKFHKTDSWDQSLIPSWDQWPPAPPTPPGRPMAPRTPPGPPPTAPPHCEPPPEVEIPPRPDDKDMKPSACEGKRCANIAAWQCKYKMCRDCCKVIDTDKTCPRHVSSYVTWQVQLLRHERAKRSRGGRAHPHNCWAQQHTQEPS